MLHLSLKEEAFLRFQRVGVMAISSEDDYPRAIPLCYILHHDAIYIGTGGKSWKVRRLAHDDRVTFLVHEYSEDWENLRGIRLSGRASVLRSGAEYDEAKAVLFAKYPQYGTTLEWVDGEDVLLKITPEARVSWHL
jgi:nitroimidazol reductase NimA-like FMN-containing flavoprotein (pyridoxamine 5'-phosphate oxidase superfamily)